MTTVDGGRPALALLSEDTSVSLVLVDVLMPEMDGLELLRIFKTAYASDIPIIMISSSEDPDTIAQAFQSGAEDFLQKPIRFEMLKRRVEMCLEDRLRRRKETMYQEMLKKERENRNRLSKQVKAQEKELEQIKSQISDTIETPMQVVMKTIGDLMEGTYSVEQYKGALVAILKSLGSRDLYRPAFSLILEKQQSIDETTRKWLQTEFMSSDEDHSTIGSGGGGSGMGGAASGGRRSSREDSVPLISLNVPASITAADAGLANQPSASDITTMRVTSPRKGVHFDDSTIIPPSPSSSPSLALTTPISEQMSTSVLQQQQQQQHVEQPVVQPVLLTKSIRDLESFEFDVFAYQVDELLVNTAYMFQALDLIDEFEIDTTKLMNFLRRIQQHYKSNPYHNIAHALDVTQFVYCCLSTVEKISNFLSPFDKLCIMVSALCHDLDHPGLNNNYQINAKTALALLYNDISVLENHHCFVAFKMMRDPECNLVESLDLETYREFRKTVITTILATDMAHHFEFLAKFQTRTQTGPLSKESKDDKQQLINIILKCADVSNAVRPFRVAKTWANRLIEEFLYQGDQERAQGLAISPLMDRSSLDKEQMQVNFIDYIAGPLYKSFIQFVPNLQCLMNSMHANREQWSSILSQRPAPTVAPAQQQDKEQQQQQQVDEDDDEEDDEKSSSFDSASPSSTSSVEDALSPTTTTGTIIDDNVPVFSDRMDVTAKVRAINVVLIGLKPVPETQISHFLHHFGFEVIVYDSMDGAAEQIRNSHLRLHVAIVSLQHDKKQLHRFIAELRQQNEAEPSEKHHTAVLGLDFDTNAPLSSGRTADVDVDKTIYLPTPCKPFLLAVEDCVELSMNHAEPVNMELSVELSGGELNFTKELLFDLLKESQQSATDFETYIREGNWDALNMSAHSIKGASSQLACGPLSQAAFMLERAAKLHESSNLEQYLVTFKRRVKELEVFLCRHCR